MGGVGGGGGGGGGTSPNGLDGLGTAQEDDYNNKKRRAFNKKSYRKKIPQRRVECLSDLRKKKKQGENKGKRRYR